MKKIIFLAAAFIFTLACGAQTPVNAQTATEKKSVVLSTVDSMIKITSEKHDFGKIKQGVPVNYAFELKNITDKPIVVENSWASCGCTVPEKITEPIMPGATAKLKVQYSAASPAPFTKDVYIKLAGVDQPKTVQITGEVLTVEAFDVFVKSKGNDKEKDKAKTTKETKNN